MAWYDLPATVDKILSITGATQLSYVGHSQGCEIAIAQLSRDPVLSKKINIFIGLAPATYLGDLKSPIKYLAPYTKYLEVRHLNVKYRIKKLYEVYCLKIMFEFHLTSRSNA